VPLDDEALAVVRAHVSELLGEEVRLRVTVDPRLRGAVVYLDERRQLEVDLSAPLRDLGTRLQHALALRGEGEVAAADVVGEPRLVPEVRVVDTNLKRALDMMRGSRAVLRTQVPVDADVVELLKQKLSAAAGREMQVALRYEPRLDASAVLDLGEERRIVLDARYSWLRDVTAAIENACEEASAPLDVREHLRRVMEQTEPELRLEEVRESGRVLEVGDGIAIVSGMGTVGSQELVEFANGTFGIAFSLMKHQVGCLLLGCEDEIGEGSGVRRTGHLLKVPVGPALAGRTIDALGRPIDGRGPIAAEAYRPIERKAPGVVARRPVDTPLHTGIKVIDALVPLGRGQRELVIGDRTIGKTSIAVDTIIAQAGGNVQCVYASIGQKASSVARFIRTLEENGALGYTTVVAALPGEQPAFRYITPYAGCAVGEYVMDAGGDALVIYDDLSKHAVTYRELSALLKRPIGREAYPGDIFYVHSRLLERAARMSESAGDGSLTALAVVETLAGDIAAFIPTNVISICDGQIMLDAGRFNEGVRPAMDVGLSVSRVGGAAQTGLMKQVAGRLRIDLAQYEEMAQFVKFGAEVDQATLDQLARGERCREALKQSLHQPLTEAEEIAVLYAVVQGLLDELPVEDLGRFEEAYIGSLRHSHAEVLAALADGARMDEGLERTLHGVVDECLNAFTAGREADAAAAGFSEPLLQPEEAGSVA
jgi:F-type H+-transporting ATPase subunit alpha